MRFTPDYNIIYKGQLHETDETFEIDEEDMKEMSRHGVIEERANEPEKEPDKPTIEKPRRGRPPKEVKHETE